MKNLFLSLFILISLNLEAKKISVLLITGGHSFDTVQFFNMFEEMKEIRYTAVWQPEANKMITSGEAGKYDLLVFYDMIQPVSEETKASYINLTKTGIPLLFLHHSLASYQNWTEFEKLLGGKYVLKGANIPESQLSTYKHDVWVEIKAAGPGHPVTKGLESFRLFDEVYGNYTVGAGSKPLLTTTHPESTPVIAWENRYNSSKIIYLQPGHDKNSYNHPQFRKLLLQAILYLKK